MEEIYKINDKQNQKKRKKSINREQKKISIIKQTINSVRDGNSGIGELRPSVQIIYKEIIEKVARGNEDILITGETGTGKEFVANIIREISGISEDKFIPVEIAQLSENLIESELFGHEKGAFTSALNQKIGYIEKADNGILFFDEISEIPMNLQVKLLRVLEHKKFDRVGGTDSIASNFRLICASNKPLEDLVSDGKFREDLYYRINTIRVQLPPLRDHYEDIKFLAKTIS